MELDCKIQSYDWGKHGLKSKVAVLYKNANPVFNVEENKPYAELWMGTHPNAPSVLKESGKLLSSVIKEKPEYLGNGVIQYFGNDLPYLFKVLSVNKALSIQAHPSKKHAEQLHKERPDLYKDPNHKPELAIALTPFEALCGFRQFSDIKTFIKENLELQNVIGPDNAEVFLNSDEKNASSTLKDCFSGLMHCSSEKITLELKSLLNRFSQLDDTKRHTNLAPLVEKLNTHYPNDVGCFSVYFLNFLKLEPLEALYLGPNEPHAYLFGDCIECMACSDNVVRAGLTPKYIDKDTLCNMLIYKGEKPEDKLFIPVVEDCFTKIFKPPVPDFAVAKIEVPKSNGKYSLIRRSCASIVLNISGSAKVGTISFIPGTVLFIPADEVLTVSDITNDLLLFQALANV